MFITAFDELVRVSAASPAFLRLKTCNELNWGSFPVWSSAQFFSLLLLLIDLTVYNSFYGLVRVSAAYPALPPVGALPNYSIDLQFIADSDGLVRV